MQVHFLLGDVAAVEGQGQVQKTTNGLLTQLVCVGVQRGCVRNFLVQFQLEGVFLNRF